jgi:spore coat polysaccharide biosynthesis protein SpsF
MKIVLITQARLGSTRFPNKIIKKIDSKTILATHLDRLKNSKIITDFIVASTFEEDIYQIKETAKKSDFSFYQGSTEDVLDRFYQSVKNKEIDYIVRVTSDCPLIDPSLVDNVINFTIENELDYGSNILVETFPDGQDVEVFTKNALETAWKKSTSKIDREHVTLFIKENSSFLNGKLFKSDNYFSKENYRSIRMTVDHEEDLNAIKILVNNLGFNASWQEYSKFIIDNNLLFTNQNIIRNEGLINN